MTAALAISIAPETAQSETLRERVQVLESRPGARQVLLVTEGCARSFGAQHAVIVLGGGGGGFAVTCPDGVPLVHGGLPLSQRQRLANAIGGSVLALSPPSDRPVMDRSWRLCEDHVTDMRNAVNWTRQQWPLAQTWVLGLNSGALSAAVATASIDTLAGAVLSYATLTHTRGRKTLVTVHDERQVRPHAGHGTNVQQFNGKEHQVVDVVARWILTGTAPDEIR
jgi:hypothetical protein